MRLSVVPIVTHTNATPHAHNYLYMSFNHHNPSMDTSLMVRNEGASSLLCLTAELRLQIYEYVVGSRVVHVRIHWTGMGNPSGYKYACLDDAKHLLERRENDLLAYAVPFGPDLHGLVNTCRQLHQETACLPYRTHTWAFENPFTLEQWLLSKTLIPAQHKLAIRTVAVADPGPYRSSERLMSDLGKIILIGSYGRKDESHLDPTDAESSPMMMITLKRDGTSGAWIRVRELSQ